MNNLKDNYYNNDAMRKIVLIILYFGRFRNDNSFWLKSVELNPSIDFLIFTDQNVEVSGNVKIVRTTFPELVKSIQNKFDFKIAIPQSYKLCDFRPAYGDLFQEYIKDYDFWGHCDNDLIFGDIRKFITEDILESYDRILIRGHFTLYRNTLEVNRAYKEASPSYKIVFSDSKNYCFDEYPGTGAYWDKFRNHKLYNQIIFDDIYYLKHEFVTVHKKELDRHRSNFIYSFENGQLFRVFNENNTVKKEEIMYVHFQKRNLAIQTKVSNFFTIVPNRYISYVNNPSVEFLKQVAHKKIYWPYFKIKYKSFKRKMIALMHK